MKITDFTKKYKITDVVPREIEAHVYDVANFTETLQSFFEIKFDGLVIVNFSGDNSGRIKMSEEYLAFFFKILLRSLNGERILNLEIIQNHSRLCIITTADGGVTVDSSELSLLVKSARNAGFEIERVQNGFMIYTALITSKELTLRARSAPRGLFEKKLYQIFFGK